MPFEVSRAQLKDGEVTVSSGTNGSPTKIGRRKGPQLWFHAIEATIEGMSTRAELAEVPRPWPCAVPCSIPVD
jgi:hypothetical protein